MRELWAGCEVSYKEVRFVIAFEICSVASRGFHHLWGLCGHNVSMEVAGKRIAIEPEL